MSTTFDLRPKSRKRKQQQQVIDKIKIQINKTTMNRTFDRVIFENGTKRQIRYTKKKKNKNKNQ